MGITNQQGAAARPKPRDYRQKWAFLFCLPNILFFLVFFVAPAVVGIWYSFTNYNGLKKMDFVGLENYITLFQDAEFYKVLFNTAKFVLVFVPAGYVVALGLAVLLSADAMKGSTILRILVYWPTLLSTIMVGLTWKWIFGENFGLLNYLLEQMGIKAEVKVCDQLIADQLRLEIVGEDMGPVIGRRGDTLDAIQYLTSLVMSRVTEEHVRLSIDTENYRVKRAESLERLARKMAGKAVQYRKPMVLEPMNPYERRIIHSTLQDYAGFTTYSTGSEPGRRVVIAPEGARRGYRPRGNR